MIERLAEFLAITIKKNGGDEAVSVSVLKFALTLLISIFLIFFFSGIIGFFLSSMFKIYLSLLVIGVLRYFSGGWHLKTGVGCVLFTVAVVTIISQIPTLMVSTQWILNLISVILAALLAPTGHGQIIRSSRQRMRFKWVAITIIVVGALVRDSTITLSILFQSLTLITIKRGDTNA